MGRPDTASLGTRLAAGTLRALARGQQAAPGTDFGRIPGSLRDAGTHAPPSCTGTEATLLFPVVLAEARRWGLPERETERLLPAAERCLRWLRIVTDPPGGGPRGYVPDPAPGGPYRCETQAHAHRAALLGADLLDAFGSPDAAALRDWADDLRTRFRTDFWLDDGAGGRPAALLTADGRPVPHLSSTTASLLDTGLLGGGALAPGLLDAAQTDQLAGLLGSPAMDSGWGLRGLGTKESGYNPFGHRSGAVRVHETAIAAAGLAAAGHERTADALTKGFSLLRRASATASLRCTRGSSAPPAVPRCRIRRPAAPLPWRPPARCTYWSRSPACVPMSPPRPCPCGRQVRPRSVLFSSPV